MKAIKLLVSLKTYFGSSQVLLQTQLDYAIEELEELMKPKSCEGCLDAKFPMPKACNSCERRYNDNFRPKETL